MEEIKAALLSGDGRQIMPPTLIEQVRNLNAQLLSLSTGLSSLQDIIKKISESGFNVVDDAGNVGMKYDENGLDVAAISSHMQGLIKNIEGLGLELGETSTTAYAGDKGKVNAEGITALQSIIQSVQNGFNIKNSNNDIVLKYDADGLDTIDLSSHLQGLINTLISTLITAASGTTLAPLVNSLIPSVYLPSFVDDAIEIDLFGTSAIAQYSSDNDGNTNALPDKFCYDDENKVFVIARQINNTIDLVDAGSPESGKIYTDKATNKTYRWGGTTMVPIGNDMVLGETVATAYPGDKGKLNADNIIIVRSLITALSATLSNLSTRFPQVSEDSFNITDTEGNIGMKYDESGLDVAAISSHMQGLVKSISGLGLTIGITEGTAFDGAQGTQAQKDILALTAKIVASDIKIDRLVQVEEDGFFFIDAYGNIIAQVTEAGPRGFGGDIEYIQVNDTEYEI